MTPASQSASQLALSKLTSNARLAAHYVTVNVGTFLRAEGTLHLTAVTGLNHWGYRCRAGPL